MDMSTGDEAVWQRRGAQALELALANPGSSFAPTTALRVADMLVQHGKLQQARGTLAQILATWPDEHAVKARAMLVAGRCALRDDQVDAAAEALEVGLGVVEGLDDTPLKAELLSSYAIVNLRRHRWRDAVSAGEVAFAIRLKNHALDDFNEELGAFVTSATGHGYVDADGRVLKAPDTSTSPAAHEGKVKQVLEWLSEMAVSFARRQYLGALAIVLLHRGHMWLHLNDSQAALADLENAKRMRRLLDLPEDPSIDHLIRDALASA